jgi:hypothetical protein
MIIGGWPDRRIGDIWTFSYPQDITRVLVKAVHVDVLGQRIVAIEPMPLFRQLFTEFCEGIGVIIL